MTRFMIVGAGGMLGRDLQTALIGREVTALTRSDLDVTDATAVAAAVAGHDVVINAAAYTKVDDAESDEATALLINGTGAGNLAAAAATHGAGFVQVSTDYVFDGTATTPYAEDTPLAPVSAYGRTKAEGERLALAENPDRTWIVRTAWLYGQHGPNFARTMLRLARAGESIRVVDDQVGQPTWTSDLARGIVKLVDAAPNPGVFHLTNSGHASWFDLAVEVFRSGGFDPGRIEPVASSAFPRPAHRPAYSVMSSSAIVAAGMDPLRPWREAVAEAMPDILETV